MEPSYSHCIGASAHGCKVATGVLCVLQFPYSSHPYEQRRSVPQNVRAQFALRPAVFKFQCAGTVPPRGYKFQYALIRVRITRTMMGLMADSSAPSTDGNSAFTVGSRRAADNAAFSMRVVVIVEALSEHLKPSCIGSIPSVVCDNLVRIVVDE